MRGKLSAVAARAGGAVVGAYGIRRRRKPLQTPYSEAPKKVLIIGGGFGGLAVLEGLVKALDGDEEVGVALLDRVNFTTFYPRRTRRAPVPGGSSSAGLCRRPSGTRAGGLRCAGALSRRDLRGTVSPVRSGRTSRRAVPLAASL